MISEYNHNCNLQKTKQTPDETELDRANKNSMWMGKTEYGYIASNTK
jgi:hypothetical protein